AGSGGGSGAGRGAGRAGGREVEVDNHGGGVVVAEHEAELLAAERVEGAAAVEVFGAEGGVGAGGGRGLDLREAVEGAGLAVGGEGLAVDLGAVAGAVALAAGDRNDGQGAGEGEAGGGRDGVEREHAYRFLVGDLRGADERGRWVSSRLISLARAAYRRISVEQGALHHFHDGRPGEDDE